MSLLRHALAATKKAKSTGKSLTTAVSAAVLLMSAVAATEAQAARPLEGIELNVAYAMAPPFVNLTDSFRDPHGLEVDIIKELQERTGFVHTNGTTDVMLFGELLEQCANGKVDIASGGITYTEERLQSFDMFHPYIYNHMVVVSRQNDSIDGLNKLNGRTLAIETGTNVDDILAQSPGLKIHSVPTTFMMFYAVERNMADALIIDGLIARDYIELLPDNNLKVSAIIPGTDSGISIALKKGSPYNRALFDAFNEMKQDGTLKKLVQKYVKHIPEIEQNNVYR